MILPNLRQRLTADDHELVLTLLARGSPARRAWWSRRAEEAGPDALLDDPDLPGLLRDAPGYAAPSAALFLYVAVRHTLRRTGLDDLPLSEYVGALVFEFGWRGRAWRVSHHDDAEYRYLTDVLAAAESTPGRRGFLLRVHLGNLSLWLAGMFPDYVTERRARRGGPDFAYYETLGARGFRLASDDDLAAHLDLSQVFARAAERFPEIRIALNRLSDEILFRGHSAGRLLRQVRDEFRVPAPERPLF
jgi:hypothetical protein